VCVCAGTHTAHSVHNALSSISPSFGLGPSSLLQLRPRPFLWTTCRMVYWKNPMMDGRVRVRWRRFYHLPATRLLFAWETHFAGAPANDVRSSLFPFKWGRLTPPPLRISCSLLGVILARCINFFSGWWILKRRLPGDEAGAFFEKREESAGRQPA
jgi:hypothetical protein